MQHMRNSKCDVESDTLAFESAACGRQLNCALKNNRSLLRSTNLKSSTILKWLKEDLVKTTASLWLQFEENTKGEVTILTCSNCKQFQNEIGPTV